MESKTAFRKKILKELAAPNSTSESFLGTELDNLWDQGRWDGILGYSPLPGEPEPRPLLRRAQARGLKVFFPRVSGPGELDFLEADTQFSLPGRDYYSIPCPGEDRMKLKDQKPGFRVIVLVPGMCFDLQGNRLGRGKGFYDRFLAENPENRIAIGLAWPFQVVESVPVDSWDQKVQGLLVTGFPLRMLKIGS